MPFPATVLAEPFPGTLTLDRDGVEFERWGGKVLPAGYVIEGSGDLRFVARCPIEWDDTEV